MKNLFKPAAILLSLLLLLTPGFSQKSKNNKEAKGEKEQTVSKAEELKRFKARAKEYVKNPMMLKAEIENYQGQINDLKVRNKQLENQVGISSNTAKLLDDLRTKLASKDKQLSNLKSQFNELQEAYRNNQGKPVGVNTGLVYRVQIGAFVLDENAEDEFKSLNNDTFTVERSDGFSKYVLGVFETQEEADKFKGKLMEMGMRSPFVVPYIDGVRVSMEEARNYGGSQGNPYNISQD